MVHPRPKKRRKSILRYIEYLYMTYVSTSPASLTHHNEYYMSRALVEMVMVSRTKEAVLLRMYKDAPRVDITELANLTFDFLKTSPMYNNDDHCFAFMDDNLIPYYEVDNTKTGTYIM